MLKIKKLFHLCGFSADPCFMKISPLVCNKYILAWVCKSYYLNAYKTNNTTEDKPILSISQRKAIKQKTILTTVLTDRKLFFPLWWATGARIPLVRYSWRFWITNKLNIYDIYCYIWLKLNRKSINNEKKNLMGIEENKDIKLCR